MAATFQPSVLPNLHSQLYGVMKDTFNATVTDTNGLYTNHENATEDKTEQQVAISTTLGVQIVAFMVMVGVCSVLGTLGNIPVLLVYCASNERRTSNTFIKILAVIDLVVCAVIMPYSIVMELHLVTSDIVCRMFEFLRHLSITASNLTLVAIAIERYVAVCLIGHRLSVHNVNQGMVVVVGVSVVMAVPSMGLFAAVTEEEVEDVTCVFPHNFDANASFCHFTTSLLGPMLSRVYQTALMLVFLVTFIAIVVLYAIVYSSLWRRAKRRSLVQSFRIETSSSGEKRRPRASSLPENVQEPSEPRLQEELILCLGNEASEFSSDEQVSRLGAATCELNGWARKDVGPTSSAISTRIRRVTHCKMQVHRRTARMLFLCSVVFLITWLPFWVDVFNHTHNLCLRYLFFLGNASNPLVYGISNAQFRRSFVKLFAMPRSGSCRHGQSEPNRVSISR